MSNKSIGAIILLIFVIIWIGICVCQGSRILRRMQNTVEDRYEQLESIDDLD